MTDFLGKLADQLNQQYGLSNSSETLQLGEFGKHIDWSAQRNYTEAGYLREDPYNTSPTNMQILMQEPNATVFVKKRQFSSLADNYNLSYMDNDEKLYYKTIKILFQNKCAQIAALEKLSKIQKITESVGNISDQLIPVITTITDVVAGGFNPTSEGLFGGSSGNGQISSFVKTVDRIRKIYAFNTSSNITSWITDSTNIFQSQYAQGTGTIEITNFSGFNTKTTTDIKNNGSFSLRISDPYEQMLITEFDIEKAISDATNSFYNHGSVQFAKENVKKLINDTQNQLNQVRGARKASPISIQVNSETLLGKKVIAIIDRLGIELPFVYNGGVAGLGASVNISKDYLQGGQIAGYDGLSVVKNSNIPGTNVQALVPSSELSLFQKLITAIFNKIGLDESSMNIFKANNQDTNYIRRNLRFNFSGKLIIQPMDTVHIYINSKSRYDNKLMTGLTNMFTGNGILQNLNNTITNTTNAFTTLFNPSSNVSLQLEKAAFVGADFPNYLWALIRNQFVTENEGTHVFGGVVDTANDEWSNGSYTINVNGRDNTAYFSMAQVNFKPAVDTFNGALYDPLTPFKTKFDSINTTFSGTVPELLDENKFLLSNDGKPALIKHQAGSYAGLAANSQNLIQDPSVDITSGQITRTLYAPNGLVYKWKQGIGVLTQFGSSLNINDPSLVGEPALTKQPFAGQGVMDVLSQLITGQPYNFATYWKSTKNFDGIQSDPQNKQNAAYSFYDSLKNSLAKNNAVWGNFIPFKNLVIDEQTYSKAINTQIRGEQLNQDINNKLKKLSQLNKINLLTGIASQLTPNDADVANSAQKAQSEAQTLAAEIKNIIAGQQQDSSTFNAMQNINTDVSQDFTSFIDNSKINVQGSDPNIRRTLRRQINYLTRRMSYHVRANEDKNLFIVDDFYDKDYDIQAYEQSLENGLEIFQNNFHDVKTDIINVANLLNLEVFCDTQGHIRCRPPQYNKMPSSVFYRMMYEKKVLGIQVFPQFLNDLFSDQITSLKQRLEVLEDQIRLDCAVLGINNDVGCMNFILTSPTGTAITNTGDTFYFLSDENTGTITNFKQIITAANPDRRDEDQQALRSFTSLKGQAQSNKLQFNNLQSASIILSALDTTNKSALSQAGYAITDTIAYNNNVRVDELIKRIQSASGLRIPKSSYIIQNSSDPTNSFSIPELPSIDIFKVSEELTTRIRERQKILKLLYGAIKNSQEFQYLDDDKSNTNQLLTPGNFNNQNIPEIFEHMIEDETYDDLGVGSGSRYIIKRAQIISSSISENKPLFTFIQVNGQVSPLITNDQTGFSTFPNSGNPLVTAQAIDYDMWRNYGFTGADAINIPFLRDANTQVAPYAAMLLSRARKEILQGSITISGNEFMQPGEVVFLEDRRLLFYIKSVSHNFSFNSKFTTTLELTYGHSPGEYIPEPLDVIGKLLYNNRDISDLIIQRQNSAFNETNLGVIQRDPNANNPNQLYDKTGSSNTTSFSTFNAQTINNIIYTASYYINANQTVGNTVQAKIDLRYYYDDDNPANDDLISFAHEIENALTTYGVELTQPWNTNTGSTSKQPPFHTNDVQISGVNLSEETDTRSPSQKAMDAARNQLTLISSTVLSSTTNNTIQGTPEKDRLRLALFNYIIDCWITIVNVPPNQATGGSTNLNGVPNV